MSWWTPPPAGGPSFQSASTMSTAPSFAPHPSLMDDTMDEPGTAPNHLPGYLTASLRGSPKGVHSSPEPSHQQPGYGSRGGADRNGDNGWLSNSGGGGGSYGTPSRGYSGGSTSLSGGGGLPSPGSSRFGTGGLFDRSPTMSTALTVSQLDQQRQGLTSRRQHLGLGPGGGGQRGGQNGDEDDDEWGPPVTSIEDNQPDGVGQAWDAGASGGDIAETYPTSSASSLSPPSANTQVIIFGPPAALHTAVISHFSTLGPIASSFSDPTGGNWLTVTFNSELDARRAVSRNGEILGGTWMVGVKWADPFHPAHNRASPTPTSAALSTSPQTTQQQQPSTPRTGGGSNANAIGTPIQLAPASSAFKRLVPSQAAAAASGGRDRALAEAAKGGAPGGGQASTSSGSYLGKLGELVFGF